MSELLKPPAIPLAILSVFSNQPDFCAVIGDISEEFHQRAQRTGARSAKLWYWREAFRNAVALTAREVLRTPGRTTIVALGCLVAATAVAVVYCLTYLDLHPFRRLDGVALDKSQRDILLLVQLGASLVLGWIGGRLLPGRECALALMYTLVSSWVVLPGFGIVLVTWEVSGLPELDFLYFQPVRMFLILEVTLLIGAFWLGCLWTRRRDSCDLRSQAHV
jgi:hypothetical protein